MAEKLKFAVIGTGGMAQGHIEKLLTLPEVTLVAFADINDSSIEKTQKRHGDKVAEVPIFSD